MEQTFSFDEFSVELEDFEVRKKRKFDRMWKSGEGGSIINCPLIHDSMLYFGAMDGYLYAVDLKTKKEKWRYKTGGKIYFSSPVIHDGVIYIGSYDYCLYAISLEGKGLWQFRTGGEMFSSPLALDGRIYIRLKGWCLYAIDKKQERKYGSSKPAGKLQARRLPAAKGY